MADSSDPLGYLDALIYGLIQGVTEFLPVSSSGHIALAQLLGLGNIPEEHQLPFTVLLHAATLIAIGIAFRKDIIAALRPVRWPAILIACVPTGICGLLFGDFYAGAGRYWWALAAAYIVTAGLLLFSERRSKAIAENKELGNVESVTPKQAAVVGLLQILTPLPGISRSGATIAGGLLAGLSPQAAVSFSFLVGLPLNCWGCCQGRIRRWFGQSNFSRWLGPITDCIFSHRSSVVLPPLRD